MRSLLLFSVLLFITSSPCLAKQQPDLWFYYATNLLVPKNVDALEKVWKRAVASGYSHVVLTDSKFARLGTLPKDYFDHCEQVRQVASKLKLEIVPAVFPVGYSNDLLYQDPNLAEGLPVKDTPFLVTKGVARVAADPPVAFEKLAFKDDNVELAGGVATFHPGGVHARLVYKLAVPRFRCYHVSVEIRTQEFSGQPEIKALGNGGDLTYSNLGVKRTQDWTIHHVVFNSLESEEVIVYFGIWEAAKGSLQLRNWKIEEVGLLNVLRRPGTPCTVTGPNGKEYVEGKDFEPIRDPAMGQVPWPGEYQVWHEPPVVRTSLPDGTRLRVSWYHPVIIYDGQVCGCISDPKFDELLADQSKRMKRLWEARGYLMSHDEFRVLGWDESCRRRGLTPGQMLAENARRCTDLLRPSTAYVWSDMFDPFHNAVKGPYYLVNGPWSGSWEGLAKDVVIMNWNYDKRGESLKWFADRGHRQVIAGFYDGELSEMRNWMDSASKVSGVVGYMYTTWRNDYSSLEKFAEMCKR